MRRQNAQASQQATPLAGRAVASAPVAAIATRRTTANTLRLFLAILLVMVMVLPLAGCKDTDVLIQYIEDQTAEVDERLSPYYELESDAEQNTETSNREVDDRGKENAADLNQATYDNENPTNPEKETSQHETNPADNASDSKATSGTEDTQNSGDSSDGDSSVEDPSGVGNASTPNPFEGWLSGTSSRSGERERIVIAPDSSQGDSQQQSPDQSSNDQASQQQNQEGPQAYQGTGDNEGPGGTGVVYGNDGTYMRLPSNTSKIAAAGQLAYLVQMLGGRGALACTDAETLSTWKNAGAFPGELDDVQVAWSGNGWNTGTIDLDAIVASGAEVVLVSTNYGNLTADQQEYLVSQGVNVVAMPCLGIPWTTQEDILNAVDVIGELLKNSGCQYDSVAAAAEYHRQVTATLETVKQANGGMTVRRDVSSNLNTSYEYQPGNAPLASVSQNMYVCVYVGGWASAMQATWNKSTPMASVPDRNDYDVSGGFAIGLRAYGPTYNSSSYPLIEYYLQHAGAMLMYSHGANTAYINYESGFISGGIIACPYVPSGILCGTNFEYPYSIGSFRDHTALLGSPQYPAILVQEPEYAERIISIAKTPYTQYNNWNQQDGYQIWVMPKGLAGSWADGTVESFLFAPWAYYMYQVGQDVGDAGCVGYVNTFYETFYRCSPADVVDNYKTVYEVDCTQ